MAKKQTQQLRQQVLAKYPKRAKLKHYRSGGFNNMRTYVAVISEAGNVLANGSGENLESALRSMI